MIARSACCPGRFRTRISTTWTWAKTFAYIVWHAETPDNVYELGTDTYVIRDGVIETQTFTAKVTPKN